ncbi:MAG TPA: hypothetical protein VF192_16610 [Longimicrobiales bacterium]
MERMGEGIGPRREALEEPGAVGIDEAPERRPGVPMEAEPETDPGAHWRIPDRQPVRTRHLHRKGLVGLTPVFGTSAPPRGASGLIRRLAYRIPEHRARHWAILMAADRVDVLEGRLGRALARPFEETPFAPIGRQLEKNPLRALGIAALAVVVAGVVAAGRAGR